MLKIMYAARLTNISAAARDYGVARIIYIFNYLKKISRLRLLKIISFFLNC